MMNENAKTLHFNLGPVQGFIGQARRTRDLWAGSFLLSWLSAQAMAKLVEEDEGKMIFPKIETDPIYKAICKKGGNPYIATLPNRFQATVSENFNANLLTQKINEKWQELADAVYAEFIDSHATDKTKEIWDRQINNFWEVQWIIGDDASLLDKRKNWRSQHLTVEGGKHCTTMGDYQELSGHLTPAKQDTFWKTVRRDAQTDYLNLRPNERLCAIAFVKRFFVHLSNDELIETIGWVPNGDAKKLANFPSTTYMAAVPWLERINNTDETELELTLTAYHKNIEEIIDNNSFKRLRSEQPTELTPCLPKQANWNNLDGNLFNQTALMNWRSTKLSNSEDYYDKNALEPEYDKALRNHILGELKKLPKQSSNFYALLLMDGDSLGKLLSNVEQAEIVSDCLAVFSQGVNNIVIKHCGVTIYAGGDDVMALVPIHKVIQCAQSLCCHYKESFKGTVITDPTISAAIIFSHFHNPFTEVIAQAHHQLDNIAKDKNDRNSIAMAIMKPGNLSAQWVHKWNDDLLEAFTTIADALRTNELPRGFFYKISDRYSYIFKQKNKEFFTAIVTAELIKSKGSKANIKLVNTIYQLCQHNNIEDTPQLSALYFARFLATEDKSKKG